jgi:hypothetical protein
MKYYVINIFIVLTIGLSWIVGIYNWLESAQEPDENINIHSYFVTTKENLYVPKKDLIIEETNKCKQKLNLNNKNINSFADLNFLNVRIINLKSLAFDFESMTSVDQHEFQLQEIDSLLSSCVKKIINDSLIISNLSDLPQIDEKVLKMILDNPTQTKSNFKNLVINHFEKKIDEVFLEHEKNIIEYDFKKFSLKEKTISQKAIRYNNNDIVSIIASNLILTFFLSILIIIFNRKKLIFLLYKIRKS